VARPFETNDPPGFGELCFVTLPVETFRALTDEAAKRGITLGQLVKQAFDTVLQPVESAVPRGPRILTEQKGAPNG
jgi:hypothetical protein